MAFSVDSPVNLENLKSLMAEMGYKPARLVETIGRWVRVNERKNTPACSVAAPDEKKVSEPANSGKSKGKSKGKR